MSIDLHCHTKLSNGSLGIEEIIVLAKKRGIQTISITDHDCMAGAGRGKIIGARNGVQVIHGVELSATDSESGNLVHILCYLADAPERLEGLCHRNTLIRRKEAHYMMLHVAKLFPVSLDFMTACAAGSTSLYKQHIMRSLIECGFTSELYGDLYEELFGENSELHILPKPSYPDTAEVIKAIHDAGGIAVLAHPTKYGNMDLLDKLLSQGLDGVEVWVPSNTDEDKEKLKAFAAKNKLLMTGGSEFHGLYNKKPVSVGDCEMPEECLTKLLNYKSRQKRLKKKAEAAAAKAALEESESSAQEA
jgi:predicted metal-dependent phosphoesterase TrpH